MSVFREREIVCGACGTPSVQPVALSIHGSRAPALLAEIRAGRFHRFRCASCNADTLVDGPLLVIDFQQPWWVQLYPRAWVSSWRALEADAQRRFDEAIAVNAPDFVRELAPAFVRRVVFGLGALREKLLLRDAAIDDVTLECAKLLMIAERTDAVVEVQRVHEIGADSLTLVGAPEGAMTIDRLRLSAIGNDPSLQGTREKLSAGPFVDAQRIFEPGTDRAPPGSVRAAK